MNDFQWNEKRQQTALLLADGYTQKQVAAEVGVTDRTIRSWLAVPAFAEEVDRLSLMTHIASRAERLRLAKRVIRQKMNDDGTLTTKADLLEWLKFAQSETDGIKLDIAKLLAAVGADEASLAGSGSD